MSDFLLAVGTVGATDYLVLAAATGNQGFRLVQGGTGQTATQSDSWDIPIVDPYGGRNATAQAYDDTPTVVTLPLQLWSGAYADDIYTYVSAVYQKTTAARVARGVFARGTPITLGIRFDGSTDFVYYDVISGVLRPFASSEVSLGLQTPPYLLRCVLELTCYAYARGIALTGSTSPTLTAGSPQSQVYRRGVPGHCDALTRYLLTDVSPVGVINRVVLARRFYPGLLASSYQGVYVSTQGADATQPSGTYNRVTASQSWKQIAQILNGVGSGLFHIFAEVRDTTVVLSNVTNATATPDNAAGTLKPGTYFAYLTTQDGSGNESIPIALPTAVVDVWNPGFLDMVLADDKALWDAETLVGVGTNANSQFAATIVASVDAAYTLDGLSSMGYRAQSSNGGTSTAGSTTGVSLFKATPGGGNTMVIRMWMRINTASGAGGTNNGILQIPLVGVANLPLISLYDTGTGWFLSTQSGTTGPHCDLPMGQMIHVEVSDAWAANVHTINVWVNEQQVLTNQTVSSTSSPGGACIGAYTGGLGTQLSVDFAEIQISNARIGPDKGEVVYAWTPAASGSSYNLYFSRENGTYRKVAVGGGLAATGYTLASMTAGSLSTSGPPEGVPTALPALLRVQYGVQGGTLVTQQIPTPCELSNNKWERLLIATVPLPPAGAQEDGVPLPWQINIQVLDGGTAGPTVDVYHVWIIPADERDNFVELSVQGAALATKAIWQYDIRHDGVVSCVLYDAANPTTVIAQADVSGRFMLGNGENSIVPMVEVSDGSGHYVLDTTNAQFTLQEILRPRYRFPIGRQPRLLTVSGNEITDITRWRSLQGDGRTYPDGSTGMWSATTNLLTNGGFETNTTGWAAAGAGGITRILTAHLFGSACGKVACNGAATGAAFTGTGNATQALTYTATCWVKADSAGDVGKTLTLQVASVGGTAETFTTGVSLTAAWQRVILTFTYANASHTGWVLSLLDATGQGVFNADVDGVQYASNTFARPYVETNGGTATRAAARVQIPLTSTLLNPATGCFAALFQPGFSSSEASDHVVFSLFKTTTDELYIYYNGSNKHWLCRTKDGGVDISADFGVFAFNAGDTLLIAGQWTQTGVSISINAATPVSATGRGTPFTGQTTQDVGSLNGGSIADGTVLWVLVGTGFFSAVDLSTLLSNGAVDPTLHTVLRTANIVFSWWALSDQYNEG